MIIGIDVGGTHTDGVLLDQSNIVALAKVPTRRDQLAQSVFAALDTLLTGKTDSELKQIERIVFSTTLTTNLIAEGQYPPTGLVLIPGPGMSTDELALGTRNWVLQGSIDHRGRLVADLNHSEVEDMIQDLRTSGITDLAIVSKFSSRNPSLEEEVQAKVRVNLPHLTNIQIGHRVAPGLNFPRRVQTCLLNTAVLREYANFIKNVEIAVRERGIAAGLFLLKADGGTMPLTDGLHYGVETIKSGPAASIMGFLALSAQEKRTALLLDIGGTTTDIAFTTKGVPLFEPEGVRIGQFLTAVRGLLSRSIAYGGDSSVLWENGELVLKPTRRGPAITFGGSEPTLTDALVVLGLLEGDHPERVFERFPSLARSKTSTDFTANANSTASDPGQKMAAQLIVQQFYRKVREAYTELLAEINGRPVYTIHELLAESNVEPEILLAVGGPAPALLAGLAAELGLEGQLPTYHHVANALGAAVARPTIAHTLYADTAQKFYTLSGVPGKQNISGRFTLHNARQILLKHTAAHLATLGSFSSAELATLVEITHEEQFNIVRGFSTTGQILKLVAQVKPGLTSTVETNTPGEKGGRPQ